jgi:hypothetical protein
MKIEKKLIIVSEMRPVRWLSSLWWSLYRSSEAKACGRRGGRVERSVVPNLHTKLSMVMVVKVVVVAKAVGVVSVGC